MNQEIDPNDDVFGLFSTTNTTLRPCNSAPLSKSDRLFLDSDSDDDENDGHGHGGGGGGGDEYHLLQYNNNNAASVESASRRIDHMLQFLDRQLSVAGDDEEDDGDSMSRPLPEYVGKGGGSGMFRVPPRGAVHPGRPVSLEVRPHPLREAQVGRFLRAIIAAPAAGQLWAAAECGMRVWRLGELYSAGDEDGAVPFRESATTPAAMCAAVDESAARVVWSGHRDGRIRCWAMDQSGGGSDCFREVLSWQAHRGPVLSLVISSYGDLWSGSEGGGIKIWPWEAIERSLSLTADERPMATLTVERSFIDPRGQVAVNGFGNALNSDVKFLLSDNTGGKVWSAGLLSFALWDARTRELLKVFNIDGQLENRGDISLAQEVSVEYVSGSKKEKAQNSVGFFQRSRNAIMGAADAVRRVAAKGAFGDDNRRTEALATTIDGMVWSGCANGLIVQWDGNGNRVQDFLYHSYAVQCFCSFGTQLWVGYLSGYVQVLDLEGKVLGGWVAHSSPVIDMTAGAGFIFTLANLGGIRGWNVSSLGRLDGIVRSELAAKESLYTKIENLKILTGTWNVGQGRASHDSLISWLGSVTADVSIVVVGLQEVEMGAGFLAVSAAKETVGLEGSSVGQWWLDVIGKILDEGSTFVRVGSRQLAGLLIAAWVRNDVRAYIGDVDAAAVPCGFGRAIGNKGAVGLRLRVYDRILCVVNCHFAAHLDAVNRRNADFDHVYRTMTFSRPTNLFSAAAVGASSAVQMLRSTNTGVAYSSEGMPELSEADMVVFLGDFNYRLDGISYDEARDFVSQRSFDWLKERDQLRAEMEAGNVFQGMREAVITFPPTYKFEKHQVGLAGYDSGEKKRIPAWCDRILYRDSRSNSVSECGLDCPVVSSILQYEACMDVTDSDHKPVRSIFTVDIARVDESVRRQELGRILGSNKRVNRILEDLVKVPETIISTNNIILQKQDTSILRITNKSSIDDALFEIVCQGQTTVQDDGTATDHLPRGSFGFPQWLEVVPATGIISPDDTAEVTVHHNDFQTLEEFVNGVPQNSWCEDFRDKEVILMFKVSGRYTTESRKHRVRVRHCFSSRGKPDERESRRTQGTLLHRSDLQRLSGSHDVVDHLKTVTDNLKDLRSP